MTYILDTNVIRTLLRFFPKRGKIFESIWEKLDELIDAKKILSVDECFNELKKQFSEASYEYLWIKNHKQMFQNPSDSETVIIANLFLNPKMQESIHQKNIIENRPSADVYIAAKASALGATVVTAEKHKPHSAQLPNICEELNVTWISYDDFMETISTLL